MNNKWTGTHEKRSLRLGLIKACEWNSKIQLRLSCIYTLFMQDCLRKHINKYINLEVNSHKVQYRYEDYGEGY